VTQRRPDPPGRLLAVVQAAWIIRASVVFIRSAKSDQRLIPHKPGTRALADRAALDALIHT
jgi:hypothetical protein